MQESGPYIKRYVSLSVVVDTLTRRAITLMDPQSWPDRNDGYFMDLYKTSRKLSSLYALCAANGPETFHHWGVFAKGMDGACLELEREPLEAALAANPNVKFGKIEYLRLDEVEKLTEKDVERLPFSKRAGYMDEDEYRIVAWDNNKQANALGIPIDLSWIHRIALSPWIPERVAASVKECLKSLKGCKGLPIYRSQLIDSKRWKDAGDKVVGKTPSKAVRKMQVAKSPRSGPSMGKRK